MKKPVSPKKFPFLGADSHIFRSLTKGFWTDKFDVDNRTRCLVVLNVEWLAEISNIFVLSGKANTVAPNVPCPGIKFATGMQDTKKSVTERRSTTTTNMIVEYDVLQNGIYARGKNK